LITADSTPYEEIAFETYLYLYPIMVMEETRQRSLAHSSRGDQNLFHHSRTTANHRWRLVARTNIDTLFSSGWIDLSEGSGKLEIPKSHDRFYMFQLLDMWTDTFGVIGSRTVGEDGISAQLFGPGVATEVIRNSRSTTAIRCPTNSVWIIGRTAVTANEDLQSAHEFLSGVSLIAESESQFMTDTRRVAQTSPSSPVETVESLSAEQFFEQGIRLLRREYSHLSDLSQLLRMKRLGLDPAPGATFPTWRDEIREKIEKSVARARQQISSSIENRGSRVNGWNYSIDGFGTWGNDYLRRAAIAKFGLAANPPEDAVYFTGMRDSDGRRLTGEGDYLIRFNPGEFPPAGGFWSITLYDANGHLFANDLNRYGLRSRDVLRISNDGSLTILISQRQKDAIPVTNWIPSCPGPIDLCLRIYSPSPEVLDATWLPPQIKRL
jgi:hypothetical protein